MTGQGPALAERRRFTVIDPVIMAAAALESLPSDRGRDATRDRRPDLTLLATCRRLVQLQRKRRALFTDGEPRHGPELHTRLLRPIDGAMAPLVAYALVIDLLGPHSA